MEGAYSSPLKRANRHVQGSSWPLDDIELLMCVWANRQHRVVPRSLSTTFVDDSNSTAPTAGELQAALTQTELFDTMSGQKVHPGRVY